VARKGLAAFQDALDEDLNTPEALAALFVMVGEVNAALDRTRGAILVSELLEVQGALASMDRVLGLLELASRGREVDDDFRAWVEGLLEERRKARQSRDFARADAIRVELTGAGVVVEDSPEGSRWKRIQG
jgi:cysteinyl-tRNA synthetase